MEYNIIGGHLNTALLCLLETRNALEKALDRAALEVCKDVFPAPGITMQHERIRQAYAMCQDLFKHCEQLVETQPPKQDPDKQLAENIRKGFGYYLD